MKVIFYQKAAVMAEAEGMEGKLVSLEQNVGLHCKDTLFYKKNKLKSREITRL